MSSNSDNAQQAPLRLGFVGLGWIGQKRCAALLNSGLCEMIGFVDADDAAVAAARELAPGAQSLGRIEELLDLNPEGIVIATPSALHARESITALKAGAAVFCQKPLGRDVNECRSVIEAASESDRLIDIDMCYRHVRGVSQMRDIVQSGELGDVFAVNAVFHNAYGPDKPWYYDARQSGGGCLYDLGIHLVDLALWVLGFPQVSDVSGRVLTLGQPLLNREGTVEDYAVARVDLVGGASLALACSWRLSCGMDAVIETSFYGTQGGIALRNVNGSFYDFVVERYRGTARETISHPPDEWGGRAAIDWARRLRRDRGYDPAAEQIVRVAEVLDAIYASAGAETAHGITPSSIHVQPQSMMA